METLVVGVATSMRTSRGVTHQEYPIGVDIQPECIHACPMYDSRDVPRRFGVAGLRSQSVAGVDADDPLPGEIVQNVCVDLFASVAAAFGKGTAMYEDQCRAEHRTGGGVEYFECLPFVRAVGYRVDFDPLLRRMLKNFAEFFDHQADMTARVCRPFWPDLRHQCTQLGRDFGK